MPWPKDHVKKEKVLAIRLTKDQFEQLEKLAKAKDLTPRRLLEKIASEHIEKNAKKDHIYR